MKRSNNSNSGSNFRTVSGVVTTFISLVILYYVGGILFYKVYESLDATTLSNDWLIIYNALYDFFGLGLSIYLFILIFCIVAPLLWIYLGRKGGDYV